MSGSSGEWPSDTNEINQSTNQVLTSLQSTDSSPPPTSRGLCASSVLADDDFVRGGKWSLSGDVADVPLSETDLTFGVGAGVRWDISDRWYAKAVYRMNWTEFSGFDELTLVHGATVSVGFRF